MAVRDHLALFLTVQEIVKVLHRDELVPSVFLGHMLQLLELPCRHGARANVAHPAALDDIVEGTHNLLLRRLVVEAVDLEDVDVRSQTLHTRLDGVDDVLARETKAVHKLAVVGGAERGRVVISHGEEDLGHDDDAFARNVVLLERLADDLLRLAVAVDIRRVPGVDAVLVGVVDQL